jgi:hypothetical protein
MEQKKIFGIDLLEFGNSITMRGMVMNDSNSDILVLFPGEKEDKVSLVITPSQEEWFEMQNQFDLCITTDDQGKLLKKGQRVLDQKICWAVYRRDKYKCRYCGINNVPLTVDHIITWESGGATHPNNLLTSCRKCNKKRGNLDYGSWMQHKYYTDKAEKYLTEKERKQNDSITRKLKELPRVSRIRSR